MHFQTRRTERVGLLALLAPDILRDVHAEDFCAVVADQAKNFGRWHDSFSPPSAVLMRP
jgi:hypothetical protein